MDKDPHGFARLWLALLERAAGPAARRLAADRPRHLRFFSRARGMGAVCLGQVRIEPDGRWTRCGGPPPPEQAQVIVDSDKIQSFFRARPEPGTFTVVDDRGVFQSLLEAIEAGPAPGGVLGIRGRR